MHRNAGVKQKLYRANVARLSVAQKSGTNAPAYTRFANRALGRRLAAVACIVGLTPNQVTGDEVNNIIITRIVSNRNGFLQKNMLWQMDKSFQVVTTSQKPGEAEITTTMKVTWNEDNDE